MADKVTYHGSCHCGAVRYEAQSAPITGAMSCNCSYCGRRGALLVFVPAADFTLLTGREAMTEYLFNKKVIHHLFCSTCGIGCFGHAAMPDGTEMVALNARCLAEIDPDTLEITHYDGKNLAT